MRKYSVKIYDDVKGWLKRGVRVVCHTGDEAIALAKARLHIPQEQKVFASYKICG